MDQGKRVRRDTSTTTYHDDQLGEIGRVVLQLRPKDRLERLDGRRQGKERAENIVHDDDGGGAIVFSHVLFLSTAAGGVKRNEREADVGKN